VKEYSRIRDIVHIVNREDIVAPQFLGLGAIVTYCHIAEIADMVTSFDPCELCCECQAYEATEKKGESR
jgi:hypothetical protein